jgi:DNA-binding CsgD family transcriptional regulator
MVWVLWLIALFGCTELQAQTQHVFGKSYVKKYNYVDSLEQALNRQFPSQQSKQLAVIHQLAEVSAKMDEETGLLLELLEYKTGLPSYNPNQLSAIENRLGKVIEENPDISAYIRADIMQFLGHFYLDIHKKNSLAFEYFLRAYNEYEQFTPAGFPQKRLYIYDLAGAYYRYDDHSNAIKYMNEALLTANKQPFALELTMLNTIGLSYRELRRYDSATLYFNKAYNMAKSGSDSVWMGILSGNIGELSYLQNDHDQAILRLEECLDLCLAHNIKRNAVMAACRLAEIYLDRGDIAAAGRCLNRTKNVQEHTAERPNYPIAQRLYSVTARWYAATGNSAVAYIYADSALRAKDSAYALQIRSNLVKAREKAQYVQDKLKLAEVAQQKQRQFFIRNSLIVTIILLTVLGLLFMNRQRLQQKKLAAELDAATSKLINATNASIKPTESAEEQSPVLEETDPDPEAIAKLENASLLTNEQWDEFRKLFDKVHKGFLNNLKRKRPDLSPADIRFIALSKLRLSSREMASMLGVSPGTIRIYKFRLRKKLGLDKDEDIEDFINKL